MKVHDYRPSKIWFLSLAAVLLAASAAIVYRLPEAQAANPGDSAAATYSQGVLHVTLPYKAPRAGAGLLHIEVLDPDDAVLGHTEATVDAANGKGTWQQDLKLSKDLPVADLVWHRVRYAFSYTGEQQPGLHATESISQILRTPVLHILGQQSYLSGGPAAVRVIVTDSKNEPIAGTASVRIDLMASEKAPRTIYTGRLNRRGTTEAQFRFPAGLVGTFPLRYIVDTPIGSTDFTQQVRLEDKASILLTTEKPIYQPGQTIHVRALALDRSRHEASASRPLTFELEDSRGNKVFKKATQTDAFGIASAEFGLADEVNLGTYHLRALMGASQGTPVNTAEIAVNVERYVLPKFKVAVELGDQNAAAKHGYRPGSHVTGTVRANYFFGKPVDGAEITVKAVGMDVALVDVASAQGKTDADGAYKFDLQLPTYFAGRSDTHGAARVLIEATVKDSAAHSESRGEPITVSQSPLILTAVPEGGTLIPNLENQIFILASYPDGKPAQADVRVHSSGNTDQTASTDAGGVAVVSLKAGVLATSLDLEAKDQEGNRTTTSVTLESRYGTDQILLRTERAVYRAGEAMHLRVFSTRSKGTAYVDVVKNGQTVLTRDLDLANGQAELVLPATPDLAGTFDCNAYQFGADARVIGDHRLVFVQPADELKIEATPDAPTYKPGDEARVRFRVTNSKGEGVQAALGLQVVDEAVFALAEKQPGFAKVFFYLEQEVMKPRYEIHSLDMPEVVETAAKGQADRHDRAARALFSATEMVSTNKFETEVGRTIPQTKYPEYLGRYQARFTAKVKQLTDSLNAAYRNDPKAGDLDKVAARLAVAGKLHLRDSWDTDMRVEAVPWNPQKSYYLIRSAGPDHRFDTEDDMGSYVQAKTHKIVQSNGPGEGTIDVDIEHDRGPFNGKGEITGSIVDTTGAVIAAAEITARDTASGAVRTTRSNDDGRFTLAAVAAGKYEVRISSPGFRILSRNCTLAVRDRAVFTVTLPVGTVTDTVEVTAAPVAMGRGGRQQGQQGQMMFDREFRAEGVAAGIAGGVPGGVLGGVIGGVPANAPPPPPQREMMVMKASLGANTATLSKDQKADAAPRVRSYFPEALYINPEIITDHSGNATIAIPLADSITTWRMAMMASTAHGALGSGTGSIKVFQDFFVDLDMPVTLTQGDRVSIPVAAYNYTGARGEVSLKLQAADWYSLVEDVPDKTVAVDSGRVGGAQFTVEAKRIGKFKLTLAANMAGGGRRADIVVREIEVVPNGRQQNLVYNGRLESSVHHELAFPPTAIPEASKVMVRLYPGPLSQVIEGMDSILSMPGGCFEQTSSSTYPNVLALDYMKRTKKLTPEVHAKAEGYIANGYQRLLTFEVPGGGFSWFGNPPANKVLTAYGLMEFSDMSKVYDVDPKVIQRTQQWLAVQQQPDGSWKPDTSFINEGATNRFNTNVLRITAYLAWALENTGYQGPAVEKAQQYVAGHMGGEKLDSYTLAVLANFAADYGKDRDFTRQTMQLLLDARTEKDEQVWWNAEETNVYATGASAAVETTGLAVQALLKWGQASATAAKALNYITSKKDARGAWGTTQATIMALRAVLLASEKSASDVRGTVEVSLNGKPVETLVLTAENNDLLHQFVLKGVDQRAANSLDIRFTGKGGLAYQVVGNYFLPWDEKPAHEALSIAVAYDRTRLAQDDIATATATVRNNLNKRANMVMVDLGIPPGFDLLSEDLQAYVEKTAGQKGERLEKFSLTATQAILYFDSVNPGSTMTLRFRLRAKYPIRAKTFQSRVYEYYDPEVNSVARPVQLEVAKR